MQPLRLGTLAQRVFNMQEKITMWKHRVFQFTFALIIAVTLSGGVSMANNAMVNTQTSSTLAVSDLGGGC